MRRAGELLRQYDARPQNAAKQNAGGDILISQRKAAEAAGMSKRQQVTAVRVADVQAVEALLNVSGTMAKELTKQAREDRQHAAESLAIAMRATGMTQQAVAERLTQAGMEVTQQTISNWLTNFAEPAGIGRAADIPTVATAAELDAIQSEITHRPACVTVVAMSAERSV